jgi:hypothetical protein
MDCIYTLVSNHDSYLFQLPSDLKIELCRYVHKRYFDVVLDEIQLMTYPIYHSTTDRRTWPYYSTWQWGGRTDDYVIVASTEIADFLSTRDYIVLARWTMRHKRSVIKGTNIYKEKQEVAEYS